MKITVKCFATLAKHEPQPPELEMPDGGTVNDVLQTLGLSVGDGHHDVRLMMLNGLHAKPETQLKDGDRLGLFPAVGGG